jgi:hypothetical protein
MLTRLDLISNIHGCSSIRQGVARRLGSFSRLLHVPLAWLADVGKTMYHLPALDEIFEVLTPSNILSVRGTNLVLELRNGL